MHSHVLTDSIRTGGTHLISTSCSARGSVYKCSAALIHYWLQIRKCPGVLTEINIEPLRHSDPLQLCLFSCRLLRDSAKPVTYHSFHITHRSQTETQVKGFVSLCHQWAVLFSCILIRKKGEIPILWEHCQVFFWQELKLALGLLFVNGYCNVCISIIGIKEGCNMQMRPRTNHWTNHHVVSLPPTVIYQGYYWENLMNCTQHSHDPLLNKHNFWSKVH